MTLILNERQHGFNQQFNLKSLFIIYGGEGGRGTEGGVKKGEALIIKKKYLESKWQRQHIYTVFFLSTAFGF